MAKADTPEDTKSAWFEPDIPDPIAVQRRVYLLSVAEKSRQWGLFSPAPAAGAEKVLLYEEAVLIDIRRPSAPTEATQVDWYERIEARLAESRGRPPAARVAGLRADHEAGPSPRGLSHAVEDAARCLREATAVQDQAERRSVYTLAWACLREAYDYLQQSPTAKRLCVKLAAAVEYSQSLSDDQIALLLEAVAKVGQASTVTKAELDAMITKLRSAGIPLAPIVPGVGRV